jgi:hypothetical protein
MMQTDEILAKQYPIRPTAEGLEAILKRRGGTHCCHCNSTDTFVERDLDEPSLAWIGGLLAPDSRSILGCFAVICRSCATIRTISYEVVQSWMNADAGTH